VRDGETVEGLWGSFAVSHIRQKRADVGHHAFRLIGVLKGKSDGIPDK
jgi:hypothetical protein